MLGEVGSRRPARTQAAGFGIIRCRVSYVCFTALVFQTKIVPLLIFDLSFEL